MFWLAIFGGILFAAFIAITVRHAQKHVWRQGDLLAFIALIVTCGGAMALTYLKVRQNDVFVRQADQLIGVLTSERHGQINVVIGQVLREIIGTQAWDIKLNSAGVLIVLLSLGLVIGVRQFKFRLPGGAEASIGGGTDDAREAATQAARATAEAAESKAEQIAEQGPPATPPPVADGELPEDQKIK